MRRPASRWGSFGSIWATIVWCSLGGGVGGYLGAFWHPDPIGWQGWPIILPMIGAAVGGLIAVGLRRLSAANPGRAR